VSASRSFGSSSSDATLLCSKTRDRYSHCGVVSSASSVRQTPPFAVRDPEAAVVLALLAAAAAAVRVDRDVRDAPVKFGVPAV
jgi:hypothetical protein